MTTDLRLISSMATRELLAELVARFEQGGVQKVRVESIGGIEAAQRVQAGEDVDIVVLASGAIDKLIAAGKLLAGSRTDLVKSGIAIAVKAGAPRPDIGSEDAVRQAVLDARTISYSTGPSGVYLAQLFERWGIAEQIRDRIVPAPVGVAVGSLVADGRVELGFQQLSELMHLDGIAVLGPMPAAVQSITTFSAGLSATSTQAEAARTLLDFMTSAAVDDIKTANGMQPVSEGVSESGVSEAVAQTRPV